MNDQILPNPRGGSSNNLDNRITKYINAVPGAVSGQDGHGQTFRLAQYLTWDFALTEDQAFSYLASLHNPKCIPPWPEKDLLRKVAEAIKNPPRDSKRTYGCKLNQKLHKAPPRHAHQPKPATIKKSSPEECLAKCKEFTGDLNVSEQDLIETSPYKLTGKIQNEHFHRQGAMLAHYLFRPEDLINVVVNTFQDETSGKWKPADKGLTADRRITLHCLMDLPEIQHGAWIRFNPMKHGGVTDKQVARFDRCLLEFDDIPLADQRAVLAKISLPISAIIYSGGRSYHAWVEVGAETAEEYKEVTGAIYDTYKPLGIDLNNQNPSRMSRMPGVARVGQKQRLVYLNPEPSKKGIL